MEYVKSGIWAPFYTAPAKKDRRWWVRSAYRSGHKGTARWGDGLVRRRCWWRSFDGWPWDAGVGRHARVMAFLAQERRRVMRGLPVRRARAR